jgi:hypothetical protein
MYGEKVQAYQQRSTVLFSSCFDFKPGIITPSG